MTRTLSTLGLSLGALALAALAPSVAHGADPTLLRFRVEVRNPSTSPVTDATVDVAVPIAAAGQRLARLSGSLPVERVAGDGGQVLARVTLPTVPPGGRVPLTVDAWLAAGDAAVAGVGLLTPTAGVPSDAPEILAVVPIAARGDDDLSRVRGVYRFVRQRVSDDGYHARDRGALFALERGTGDCTEMAQLTVALARAAGIPARLAHGYRVDGASLIDPEGYHAFALVDVEGTPRIVDPQAGIGPDAAARDVAGYVITRLDGPGDAGFHRVRASDEALAAALVPRSNPAPTRTAARRPTASDTVRARQTRICRTREDGTIACRSVGPDELEDEGCCR